MLRHTVRVLMCLHSQSILMLLHLVVITTSIDAGSTALLLGHIMRFESEQFKGLVQGQFSGGC
jgi:hypothetical protein